METVRGILENACQKAFPGQITDRIPVRADCRNGLGVFSSSLPFAAAKQMRTSPLNAAKAILAQTEPSELFGSVKAQSGYLNFFPSDLWYQKSAEALFSVGDFDPRFTEEDLPPLAAASPTDRAVLQTFLRLCSRLRHLRFLGYSHGERPLEGDFWRGRKAASFFSVPSGRASRFLPRSHRNRTADKGIFRPCFAPDRPGDRPSRRAVFRGGTAFAQQHLDPKNRRFIIFSAKMQENRNFFALI